MILIMIATVVFSILVWILARLYKKKPLIPYHIDKKISSIWRTGKLPKMRNKSLRVFRKDLLRKTRKIDKNNIGKQYKCNDVNCYDYLMKKKKNYNTILRTDWLDWEACCDEFETCGEWWLAYNRQFGGGCGPDGYWYDEPDKKCYWTSENSKPLLRVAKGWTWSYAGPDESGLSCPPHAPHDKNAKINTSNVLGYNIYNAGNLGSVDGYDEIQGGSMVTNEEVTGFHKCCIDKKTGKDSTGFYKSCGSLKNTCPQSKSLKSKKEPIWVSDEDYQYLSDKGDNKDTKEFQKKFERICCK